MTQQASTKENVNKLIEFRQAVYAHGITRRRDAVFDLLDAMIAEGAVSSFAMLSQAERFQRKWPSLYAVVEDGRLNEAWLRKFLAQHVPRSGICIFALDGSPLAAPESQNAVRSAVCVPSHQ